MLKVSYYTGKVRHLSNKKVTGREDREEIEVEAICGKLAIFTTATSYRLFNCLLDDFDNKCKVVCPDCINKLSKKKREFIIHQLIVKKLKSK